MNVVEIDLKLIYNIHSGFLRCTPIYVHRHKNYAHHCLSSLRRCPSWMLVLAEYPSLLSVAMKACFDIFKNGKIVDGILTFDPKIYSYLFLMGHFQCISTVSGKHPDVSTSTGNTKKFGSPENSCQNRACTGICIEQHSIFTCTSRPWTCCHGKSDKEPLLLYMHVITPFE